MRAIQRMYRKDIPNYYILSAYTCIIWLDTFRIRVLRTDTRHSVTITATRGDVLEILIQSLRNGISPEELTDFLHVIGVKQPDMWIHLCIQEGIIE